MSEYNFTLCLIAFGIGVIVGILVAKRDARRAYATVLAYILAKEGLDEGRCTEILEEYKRYSDKV